MPAASSSNAKESRTASSSSMMCTNAISLGARSLGIVPLGAVSAMLPSVTVSGPEEYVRVHSYVGFRISTTAAARYSFATEVIQTRGGVHVGCGANNGSVAVTGEWLSDHPGREGRRSAG